MTHFFDRRDPWGNRYKIWIVAAMAFLAPLCIWSIRRIHLDGNGGISLPSNDPEQIKLEWVQRQFPVEDRVLLTWDGSSINDPRVTKLVEELVGKKDTNGARRGGSPYVASAIDPMSMLLEMQRNGVAPQEAMRRLEGTIVGSGPLRLRLTEASRSAIRKTKREIQTAMQAQYGFEPTITEAAPDLISLASIPAPIGEDNAVLDPSSPAVLAVEGSLVEQQSAEHDLELSWKGMSIGSESTIEIARWLTEYIPQRGDDQPLVEQTFFVPGAPIALAIELSEAGMSDKSAAVNALRSAAETVGIPSSTVHLVGSAVASAALVNSLSKVVWDPSQAVMILHQRSAILASMLAVICLTFLFLRDFKLSLLVSIAGLFAAASSAAVIPVVGGAMNLPLIIVPTLVLLVTLYGVLQVANYWTHTSSSDETKAVVETARAAWGPVFFSYLMIGAGPAFMAMSLLETVRNFGLVAAIGVNASLLTVMFGLPAMLQMFGRRSVRERDQTVWLFLAKLLGHRPGRMASAMVIVLSALCIGSTGLRTEMRAIRYFPENSSLNRDSWFFETNLSGLKSVETIIRFDDASQKATSFIDRMEAIRQVQEKLRSHPEISGSLSLADYQPIGERLAEDANFAQRAKYNKRANGMQQRILDGEVPGARQFYTLAEKGSDLEQSGDGKLNQPGDELWRVTAQVHAINGANFSAISNDIHRIAQETLKMYPGSAHIVAGEITIVERLQNVFARGSTAGIVATIVMIIIAMAIRLRGIIPAVVATIPCALSVGLVLSAICQLNQPLDIGSMIALPIAMALSASSTLHFLNWMQSAMKKGKSRPDSIGEALAGFGPALFQSSAIVAAGLVPLLLVDFTPISRFSLILLATVGTSLVLNLTLVPMLMGSLLGRIFEVAEHTAELKPISAPEPEQLAASMPVAELLEPASVPEPHIKPHNPAPKKRRASTRRDLDAN